MQKISILNDIGIINECLDEIERLQKVVDFVNKHPLECLSDNGRHPGCCNCAKQDIEELLND